MKFDLSSSLHIETATPGEVAQLFAAWRDEIRRGVKLRHFVGRATPAANVFSIDGTTSADELGPRKDAVWKLLSVAFGGPGFTKGTDAVSIFIGEPNADTRIVASGVTRQHTFAPHYLSGGERLSFAGAATGTGTVFASGWALEAPAFLLAELL